MLNSDLWISTISSSNYYELVYDPITVHSSASATISFNGKSFTSDASGNTSKVIPWGTFTFSDSVSGQSFERTIDRNTTELYVMPEGALYWYGNEIVEFVGGADFGLNPDVDNGNYQVTNGTKNTTNLFVQGNSTPKYIQCSFVASGIKFSNYTSLHAIITSGSDASNGCAFVVSDAKPAHYCDGTIILISQSNCNKTELVSTDYQSYTSGYLIISAVHKTSRNMNAYAIWLE